MGIKAKKYDRQYYLQNKEKIKQRSREYYRKNKPRLSVQRSKYHKDYWLRYKYGLTVEQLNTILQRQNNQCAICRVTLKRGQNLHIDHDHATGEVRGLLCDFCNRGLGTFRDNPDFLMRAAKYLRKKH